MTAYRFTERTDYTHLSSGRVFYNLPGHPAFPVRLASEIFRRCMDLRRLAGLTGPARLYDPCCGGAYHLSVLAYLHWQEILSIMASDIDLDALRVARRNLSLLTMNGMEVRIRELTDMQFRFAKSSHAEALASAKILQEELKENLGMHPIPARVFQANTLSANDISCGLGIEKCDLVITDVPYGNLSVWQGAKAESDPIWMMLDALKVVLSDGALVAIAGTKEQKAAHEGYNQVGKIKIGKRLVTILKEV